MSDYSTDVLRGLAATQWQCTTQQSCPDCEAAQQRIAELERVFTCQTCGAQFPKGKNPDVLYEGVTQCGKCVEVEALIAANVQSRKRIAELEAELQHKRRLMKEDAGVLAQAIERIAELEQQNAAQAAVVEAAREVSHNEGICDLHHGECYAHNYSTEPCVMATMRAALAALDAEAHL